MLRKLAIAIAASGAMSAAQVYALGLGEIQLDSALNQPLDARIKLVKASELENWEIKPSLASANEFENAGVERVFFLNNVKFEVEREAGEVYVNLSTQQPVVEPFLNFLVQVDWPNGRLLREYTLLLDPPVYDEDKPVEPVSAPEQQMQPEEDVPLPGTGMAAESAVEVAPVPVPVPVEEDPVYQPEPEVAQQESTRETTQERTYAVRPNDTLWEIALDVRPSQDLSPQQIMLAIQDENPDAFIKGNINRLKKNQVLRIPSESEMRGRTFRQSVAEVAVQNDAVQQRRAQLDATRKSQVIDRDDSLSGAQLTLLADGEATSEAERQAGGQVSKRTAGDQSKLDQELSLALENLDKSNRENQELRTRLEALEEQINMLQRLINLKDEQMVALQTGMSDSAVAETTAPAGVDSSSEMPSEAGGEMPESAEAADATDLNFATGEEQTGADEKVAAETPAPTKPAEQPKTPLAPKTLPPVPQPKGPMDFVMENLPLVGGGLGAILLALLGLRAVQGRKSKENTDAEKENAFLAETMDDLADHPMDGSADNLDDEFADLELGDDVVDGGVSDDLSNLEDSGLDMSATPDVGLPDALDEHHESSDVLGEADMYMAYGRLDRAKDLLETTLLTEPGRMDLKVKLLEVLSEQDDAVAFAEQFESVMADGDDEQKAAANRLRQNLSNPEAGAENELVLDSDLSGGEELDFSEFETDDLGLPEEAAELDLTDDSNDLDFDLDGLEMDAGNEAQAVPELTDSAAESDENSLDFELNLDSSDELTAELDETPLDLGLDEEDSEMSLDFDLDEADASLDADLNLESVDAELPTLDADLGDAAELESLDSAGDLDFETDLVDTDDDLPTLDLGEESSELESDLDLDQEMDLTLDSASDDLAELEALENELDTDLAQLDSELDTELDLDLDTSDLNADADEEVSLAELEAELDEEISLDVDSAELELPELSQDDDLSLDALEAEVELDAADLDLSLDADVDVPELAPELDTDVELSSEDFEAPALDSVETDVVEEAPSVEAPELAAESDGAESNAEEAGDLSLDDLDDDLDFLSGTDESETKLDLARAYIDMDDKDGAREILSEVIEEGNDEQRQEASKLMDSLS